MGELVEQLDEVTLRKILLAAADAHEDVERALRLAAAGDGERLVVLRAEVDRVLSTRRHLGYRESTEWAREAGPVVDALADAVAAGPSLDLVALLERAATHLVKVIQRADDSNGMIGDLAHRTLELHREACAAGAADPVALAKWMVRFTFDDQDFFVVDPVEYRDALGDVGLGTYRKDVAKRSVPTNVTPLRPDLEPWGDHGSYAARYAAERLAVLDGDTDQLVELLGGDLSSPHQFQRVADAMVELGRGDDALAWARRGIAETNGWQVGKLYDLAAGLLTDQGDAGGVLGLRREYHTRMPSSSTYASLKHAADACGVWDAERAGARAVLGATTRSGLVDALLADGDVEAAWQLASSGEWAPDERQLARLAEAREPVDPAGALATYLRLADLALVDTGKEAYRKAVRALTAARRAATAAEGVEAFEAHVAALREQHRRRPTFIAMLDKARL